MDDTPFEEDPILIRIPPEHQGERLDKVLTALLPDMSRSQVQKLLAEGCIDLLDHPSPPLAKAKAVAGQVLLLRRPPPPVSEALPRELPLNIVYEDDHILVIDKAAGMTVHPAPGHTEDTLVNALLFHCGRDTLSGTGGMQRPGIVHRLDKDTSGLLVVAKHDLAHRHLAAQFASHSAFRHYLALVVGAPKPLTGTISLPLGRHPVQRQKQAVRLQGGREAITHYRVEESLPPCSLLACRLETGRTHQIRVHLSHLGYPLLGDPLYGKPFQPPSRWPVAMQHLFRDFSRQALHAAALHFDHPASGERLHFNAPLPEDFTTLLQALRARSGL
ncbi:MAG: RluA family pseudouridine synthase [Magnetococcales bacterium]|nr:RluA family pseudouridine synthase [Magnetococcales bacterium]